MEDSNLDIHYIGYNIMTQALRNESIYEGLKKALYLAKLYVDADDIVLFKKEENGLYDHYSNNALMNNDSKIISILLNKAKDIIEQRNQFEFNIDIKDKQNNLLFIPITFKNSKYVITITNPKKNVKKDNFEFTKVIGESMSIILEKLETYDYMQKNSTIDSLTGLDNRNSYNARVQMLDSGDEHIVYAIFDLFRLKYINDNYSHLHGDKYIIETAKILSKYFPKYHVQTDQNGVTEKKYTGSCVYRIGGDEFVLMTTTDSLELVTMKAQMAAEEIKMLDLDIKEPLPIGMNYGIVERNNKELSQELYVKADKILADDKTRMYQELGIDRRK